MSSSETGGPAPTADSAQEALHLLASVTQDAVPTGVILIEQPPDHLAAVSQLRLTESSATRLGSLISASAKRFAGLEVIDYGPAAEPASGEVMWLPLSDVPLLAPIAGHLEDLSELPLFDPRLDRLRSVELVGIQARADATEVAFYQALEGSQILAASSKIGVIMRPGILDVPRQRGQLVILDRGVDAVSIGEFVFFTRRAAFDRLFGFLDQLRKRARDTFDDVTSALEIVGKDEMAAAVTGAPAMLGKMASIQRKVDDYPAYKAALTMPKLVGFVRSHPECGVELIGEGDDTRLVFDSSPRRRFKILKLLDDDFLRSELTRFEYEANSKGSPIGT